MLQCWIYFEGCEVIQPLLRLLTPWNFAKRCKLKEDDLRWCLLLVSPHWGNKLEVIDMQIAIILRNNHQSFPLRVSGSLWANIVYLFKRISRRKHFQFSRPEIQFAIFDWQLLFPSAGKVRSASWLRLQLLFPRNLSISLSTVTSSIIENIFFGFATLKLLKIIRFLKTFVGKSLESFIEVETALFAQQKTFQTSVKSASEKGKLNWTAMYQLQESFPTLITFDMFSNLHICWKFLFWCWRM